MCIFQAATPLFKRAQNKRAREYYADNIDLSTAYTPPGVSTRFLRILLRKKLLETASHSLSFAFINICMETESGQDERTDQVMKGFSSKSVLGHIVL